jgi:hypothetical protein
MAITRWPVGEDNRARWGARLWWPQAGEVKGRKRHILNMLGPPIASRVEPANMSDRRAGHRLLAGLSVFAEIRTVFADAGSREPEATKYGRWEVENLLLNT